MNDLSIINKESRGVTLVELMITITLVALLATLGPAMIENITRFWRVQMARAKVQKSARTTLDIINRNLRQATATSVTIKQLANQPPYSWITFNIDTGEGAALGNYGFYQEGTNVMYMKNGTTSTIADNLKYMAFTYPITDNDSIISVSMTYEESTFEGYKKALQLSIEKVRVMN